MKKVRLALQVLVFATTITHAGCALKDPQTSRDVTDPVLKSKDLACIMGSLLTDSKELAHLCNLADVLIPLVQRLVSVRDAARRAGVVYQPPVFDPDGGAVDGTEGPSP